MTSPLKTLEMIITPDVEYPFVCVTVRKETDSTNLKLTLLNLNSSSSWLQGEDAPADADKSATVINRRDYMNVVSVTQLEKDTLMVVYDNLAKFVDINGKVKTSRKRVCSEIKFDFQVDSVVCLTDSVLAFHKHGVQGRSLRNGDITQEITDKSRIFRLLGSDKEDKVIVVESKPNPAGPPVTTAEEGVNLFTLAGHESTF